MIDFQSNYLTKAILSHFFSGAFPTVSESKLFMQSNFLEILRKNIEESDIDGLFKIIEEQQGNVAAFGIDLLKKFSTKKKVIQFFKDIWNVSDEYLKCHLFWRILDDPNLSYKWHDKLYNFTIENWEVFKDSQKIFWGSSGEVIPGVLKKLINYEYPISKKWTNLVRLPELADDQLFAKSIIKIFRNSFDKRFKIIADDILNKYYIDISDVHIEWKTQGIDIQSEGMEYIANALLEFYLSRNFPTLEECEELIQQPLVGVCRKIVKENHLPGLIRIIKEENSHEAAFGVSFLRYHSTKPDIADLFKDKWNSADNYLKCHLFWRILDDPGLTTDWHQKLFDFVWEEWNVFKNVQKLFWGKEKDIIPGVLQRLADDTYPESKKWAYLCCLPEVADNQKIAKYIISMFIGNSDSFLHKVSTNLLKRFYSE